MGRVQAQVEELADNRVRLEIEVPREDVKHAVDHAASDLAQTLKIPGFRKGRVPMPVLLARVGRDRLYAEAVESHIGGWFRNAAVRTGIRPIAQPEYGYELPSSDKESFRFTATVAVQPKPEVADWTELEVPAPPVEVPDELVDEALEQVRASVAELVPVDGRPAREGDTLVVDLLPSDDEGQRDYVVELGSGRLLPEIEAALVGLSAGDTKEIEYALLDGRRLNVKATVKEVKEKVLPPLDDELARAGSEFETLAELRADVESGLREQLEREAEGAFRTAVADALVEASEVDASGPLVEARAAELGAALVRSLQRRGISLETYFRLAGETREQLQARLLAEARQSVARELVLEAAADRLGLSVGDDELETLVREEADAAGEDARSLIEDLRRNGRLEQLREDLRLRRALDRIAGEVHRISPDLAAAREKLWTPEQEKRPADTKLWTPGTKESA
ncbi:MAG: trigger factor [Actinomycetota bacterium]|nr:trigger factor [Actinomycetota bacterium]